MFKTIGERITYCRNLLGLSRVDLVSKLGISISLPTVARWELNSVVPSTKKIEILATFFIKNGISVNLDWLKTGNGYPPISFNLDKFDSSQFDELAYSQLLGIKNKIKDFFFQQVSSNFFKPVISFGDYIGGITEPNKKLMDKKMCFVGAENIVTAGFYSYEMDAITNLSGEKQELKKEAKLGEVQWIVRRS